MAQTKRTASAAILAVLKRGPQRGLTAAAISTRAKLNLNTTRSTLGVLTLDGTISIAGYAKGGNAGRPANLYVYAETA